MGQESRFSNKGKVRASKLSLSDVASQGLGFSPLGRNGLALHRSGFFHPLTNQSSIFDVGEAEKLQSKKKDSQKPLEFTEAQLGGFTNNFEGRNLIRPTQFGKVYRGKIEPGMIGKEAQDVTVKIWDEKAYRLAYPDDYIVLDEEVKFLTDPSVNHHPNLVKLIGYCRGVDVKGVVYDLNLRDSLHNLIRKESFNWFQRIKVAVRFARLLEFLHGQAKPYLVLGIDAGHIMLDQDWNPILFEFGLMSGGILGELSFVKKEIPGSIGYVDPYLATTGLRWNACCDVFSFGIIVLGLISKRIVNMEEMAKRIADKEEVESLMILLVNEWAKREYKPKCSLVHSSLEEDCNYHVGDGPIITALGMRCVERHPNNRPTMKEVVACLEGLLVVQHQHHGDEVGM
uniref:Protein kinase domain-containing protein n=1 Tax=Davidia involucrata TaxID=16924 RepID=A0A5B7ANN8_DAVIN